MAENLGVIFKEKVETNLLLPVAKNWGSIYLNSGNGTVLQNEADKHGEKRSWRQLLHHSKHPKGCFV